MLPGRALFDDFFDDIPMQKNPSMMCDIYEKDDTYYIEMDAPGYQKEDITIECDKGNLKIIAEKKDEQDETKKYVHRERKSCLRCERSFYLGNVDEDAIEATFKDGILNIKIPKGNTPNKKTIAIN